MDDDRYDGDTHISSDEDVYISSDEDDLFDPSRVSDTDDGEIENDSTVNRNWWGVDHTSGDHKLSGMYIRWWMRWVDY